MLGESMKVPCPFPIPYPMHLFHKMFEFCEWLLNTRSGSWESLIYKQLFRSTGDNLGLQLASDVRSRGSLVVLTP